MGSADHPRTQALAASPRGACPNEKKSIGYHRRSLAENGIYRFKQMLGDRLASRLFETQVTEVHVRVAALNVIPELGMPVSVPVGVTLS